MQIYTVAEVTTYVRRLLDSDSRLSDIWIKGEVSNLYKSQADHMYFTIKDADGQLKCVQFKGEKQDIAIENGMAVVLHGRLSVYESRGDMQVYVDLIQPEGVGELYLAFRQLKEKLEKEGLFDKTRKRPLPDYPKRIGIVTSPVSAAYRDIVNIITRRYPLVELIVSPTLVQGADASPGIVKAISKLNSAEAIDVIIMARGGGSLEDLWAFNEEPVARAIYASSIPIISGVGHETDYTIADYVADKRAPTPSAAAELAVPDMAELRERLVAYKNSSSNSINDQIKQKRLNLEHSFSRLKAPETDRQRQHIDDLLLTTQRHMVNYMNLQWSNLRGYKSRLSSLDPMGTIKRGYALIQMPSTGNVISKITQVTKGDNIIVQVSDGRIKGKVTGKSGDGYQGTLI